MLGADGIRMLDQLVVIGVGGKIAPAIFRHQRADRQDRGGLFGAVSAPENLAQLKDADGCLAVAFLLVRADARGADGATARAGAPIHHRTGRRIENLEIHEGEL